MEYTNKDFIDNLAVGVYDVAEMYLTLRNDEFPKNNNRKIMRNKIMEEEK